MIVDGKKIASEIKDAMRASIDMLLSPPRLAIILVGDNLASASYIRMKQRFGSAVGIVVDVQRFPSDVSLAVLRQGIKDAACAFEGVIIQLPLPPAMRSQIQGQTQGKTQELLDLVPLAKDVDRLSRDARTLFESGRSPILPPMVAAIDAIVTRYDVALAGKRIVIVGKGPLVGHPMAMYLKNRNLAYTVIDRSYSQEKKTQLLKKADIIISGAGAPGFILPDMINDHVVLIDAGTGEAEGVTRGDADQSCATKAALFTPERGGLGPIVVAELFSNLVRLAAL